MSKSPHKDARQAMAGLYKRFGMDRAHAERVAGLCARLFADVQHLHGLTKTCRSLVEATALLHDIDEAPGKDGHDVRGARRIRNLRLGWIPARWRPIIALAVALHSKQSDVAGFLRRLKSKPSVEMEVAGRVAAILRLGDGLDHCREQETNIAGVLDDGREVTIYLEPSPCAAENAAFAMRKADLWNRLALRPIRAIEVAKQPIPHLAWVRPDQPIAEAFRRILQRQFEQMASREYGLGCQDDPEFVHETRVAMRRMHSAIQAFRKHPGGLKKLDREIRDVGEPLGKVRDSDVLLDYLEDYASHLPPAHRRVLGRIIEQLGSLRQQQCGEMIAAMASPEHRGVMARLSRLARPPAGRPEAQRAGKTAGRPAWREARQSLRRQLEEIWKVRRPIKKLSPRRQHQLRIDCKKLRYLAEFFMDFYGPKIRDMIRTAVELQDLLGMAHDSFVYADWLKDQPGRLAGKGDAAIERLMQHLQDQRRECLNKAGKVWKSFRSRRSRKRLLRVIEKCW